MDETPPAERPRSPRRRRRDSGPPAVKLTILLPADMVEAMRAAALRRGYVVTRGPQAGQANLSMLMREALTRYNWAE